MTRQLTVSTIQLDGALSPRDDRLKHAAKCITDAVADDAQLIVLPALFNSGLSYDERLLERAETPDGHTVSWMREQALRHNVHLAGSLLLRDADHVYHSALLIAPDGQLWRYDAQTPFIWERALYREGNRITVANTAHGKIGLMIGWDAYHADVWERYAARVDALVIVSALPDLSQGNLTFTDGTRHTLQDANPPLAAAIDRVKNLSDTIDKQSTWLGVPVIYAGAVGQLETHLPAPRPSVRLLLGAHPDAGRLSTVELANNACLSAPFIDSASDETHHTQTVTLATDTPRPQGDQPETAINEPLTAVFDGIVAGGLSLNYQRNVRRHWGARMAPVDRSTRLWRYALGAVFVVGLIVGRVFKSGD